MTDSLVQRMADFGVLFFGIGVLLCGVLCGVAALVSACAYSWSEHKAWEETKDANIPRTPES